MANCILSKGITIALSTLRRPISVKNNFLNRNVTPINYCHKHSLPATATFDPRLRTFLLKMKENFEKEGFQRTESKFGNGSIDICHIQTIHGLAGKLLQVENELDELKALSSDDDNNKDLTTMIDEECVRIEQTLVQIQDEVFEIVLQEDTQTEGIIMEFSAGVGGQESMLFCNEILEMYCNYCDIKGWDYELTDYEKSDLEGVRHAALYINNPEAYSKLRFESGVHRVQRVPKTEKAGRVHTSTVAVAILPRPSAIMVTIENKDLKIETKRASGAGGQHVNTTESAVRITHLPSGLVSECQTQRSQIMNRQVAIDKIRARLFQMKIDEQLASTRSSRKLQVGSSGRSEKVRTYNFPQDRITDHRISFTTHNINEFLGAARPFQALLDKLQEESRKERLVEFLDQVKI